MWESPATLSAIGGWSIYIALGAALVVAFVGAAGTIASNRASDLTIAKANERIAIANARAEEAKAEAASAIERAAEANKQAEEAKAEAAKTNERLQKAQEARRLSKAQRDTLDFLFRSDVFQKPEPKQLRVASVEDAEARMFAMEFQKLMQSCGVNVYPTDGGFPSTVAQLNPDTSPLILTVQSGETHSEMQHLAHFERIMLGLGFEMKLEYDPKLTLGEGVLNVMRKAVE